MRTTIRLEDHLFREAKRFALETRQSFTQLVTKAIQQALTAGSRPKSVSRFRIRPFRGGGTRPGVNLDDNAGTRELMDRADASP